MVPIKMVSVHCICNSESVAYIQVMLCDYETWMLMIRMVLLQCICYSKANTFNTHLNFFNAIILTTILLIYMASCNIILKFYSFKLSKLWDMNGADKNGLTTLRVLFWSNHNQYCIYTWLHHVKHWNFKY